MQKVSPLIFPISTILIHSSLVVVVGYRCTWGGEIMHLGDPFIDMFSTSIALYCVQCVQVCYQKPWCYVKVYGNFLEEIKI